MQQCDTQIAPWKWNFDFAVFQTAHSMYLYAVSTLSNKLCLLVNMQRGSNSVVSNACHRKQIALLCNLFQCPG